MATADDLEAAQVKEYGTYVATVPIDFYGERAFNTGDPVPVSAVEGPAGWVDPSFVAKTSGKRGTDAFTGSATVPPPEPPTIDPATVAAPAASTPTPEG